MTIKAMKQKKLLLFFLALIIFSSCSRTGFRGTINYNVTYPGSRIDYATQEALPASVRVTANNNLVKQEMRGGELEQIQISNSEDETVDVLLEIMGEKYHIQKNREDVLASLNRLPQPEFEFTGEVKEILGYTCQKVRAVTYDDFGEEYVSVIYFTEEIDGKPFNFNLPYKDIPGLMLLFEIRTGDINMRYEAENINSRRRSTGRRNFNIPSGYKTITYEELRSKLN